MSGRRQQRPNLSMIQWIGIALGLASSGGARAAEQAKPVGVVAVLGQLDGARALAAARAAGGANWRQVSLQPALGAVRPPPVEALDALRQLYLEADFIGCLTAMQQPRLRVDSLLADGQREQAAAAAILGAACAFEAGDKALARRLLQRVIAAELESPVIADTKPELQRLMERLQQRLLALGRLKLRLQSKPARARVRVDGDADRCVRTPCTMSLRPGRHVIVLERLGRLARTLTLDLQSNSDRVVTLDPAPSQQMRAQLQHALATGVAADSADFLATIADAHNARVAVVLWARGAKRTAAVYDRLAHRIAARSMVTGGANAMASAVRLAVTEWRGKVEPTPLWRKPWFWGITLGAVAATATAVFFLTRPVEKRYVIEVPTR